MKRSIDECFCMEPDNIYTNKTLKKIRTYDNLVLDNQNYGFDYSGTLTLSKPLFKLKPKYL